MIKLVFVLKRKKGMTKEAFRNHYESSHVPMALKHMGHLLVQYRRNYTDDLPTLVAAEAGLAPDDGGPDVVTEICFRDEAGLAEFNRIYADPELHRMFVDDEKNFLERDQCRWAVSETVETPLPA